MIWWRWPGHLSNTCRLMYDLGNTDFRRWRLRCKHKFSGIRCLTAMSKVADSLSMSVPYRRSVSQCLGLESRVHQILLLQWRSSISLAPNWSPQQMIKAFNGTWYIRIRANFGRLGHARSVADVQCRELEDHGPGERFTSFNNGTAMKTQEMPSERDDACKKWEKSTEAFKVAKRFFMRIEFCIWRTGRMWMVFWVIFAYTMINETATAGN